MSLALLINQGFAQKKKDRIGAKSFSLRILDENGQPIQNARITGAEGQINGLTNAQGKLDFVGVSTDGMVIEAPGYKSVLTTPAEVSNSPQIVLQKLPILAHEKDILSLPFVNSTRREMASVASKIDPKDIFQYDNRQNVLGSIIGRTPGFLNGLSLRGFGQPLIVVDGIPRQVDNLNLQEIDEITVLRDINSRMLYGSQAENGVIMVKTKRGIANKRVFNVFAESGIQNPISYPEYLKSGEYMTLFNEALANDGQSPRFSQEQITGSSPSSYLFPDVDFYNSDFLKSSTSFYNFNGEIGGGNKNSQYYLNLGYANNGTLLNIGEGANERSDRFNVRGNVDYQLTEWLKMNFDGVVQFGFSGGANYTDQDFWNMAGTRLPNAAPFLIPVADITNESLSGAAVLYDGKYVFGGTSEFQTNPYGELTSKGYAQQSQRTLQINTGLNFDFNKSIPGLTGLAAISFDIYNTFIASQNNSYAVYQPLGDGEFQKIGQDIKVDDQTVSGQDFARRVGFYGKLNYEKKIGNNDLTITGLAFRNEVSLPNDIYRQRFLHYGVHANYTIAGKYLIDATGVVAGSSKFDPSNRFAFSPSVSLGWIVTEEDFLKDNSAITFLKFRAGYGILQTDNYLDNYLPSRNTYSQGFNFLYGNNGINQNAARIFNIGNPELGWTKRKEINVGLEAIVSNDLYVDLNYFNSALDGLPVQRTGFYPNIFGGIIPFENYNNRVTNGVELGLNYKKQIGNLRLGAGINLTYAKPTWKKFDEPTYDNAEYRQREGNAADAIFGYEAAGLFTSDAEIAASPIQTFGNVRPGDIKYRDLNGDGLVDENDQTIIGNQQRLFSGIQLNIGYKNFELFALGTNYGQGNIIFNSAYDWVFGNRKYPAAVRERWTPGSGADAAYPRLSSSDNPNNYRNSTFWLKEDRGFNLAAIQLNYSFGNLNGSLKGLRLYVRGSNLAEFGPNAERKQLSINLAPQTRNFAIGLVGSF